MPIEINDTLTLKRGVLDSWDFAEFSLRRLLPGQDEAEFVGAELFVVENDKERYVSVQLGKTFPVSGQVWCLDSIRPEGRIEATIRRVA